MKDLGRRESLDMVHRYAVTAGFSDSMEFYKVHCPTIFLKLHRVII
jgi:hypothetical protein